MAQETTKYPGHGLPLRYDREYSAHIYPVGAHGNCTGARSDIIPIREVAMLSVMDKLTDKPDWEKKVFDDKIVAKWRGEALAIPDEDFQSIATSNKSQYWDEDGNLKMYSRGRHGEDLTGILDEATFDVCVRELRDKAKYYEKTGIIPTMDACASVAKSDRLVSPKLRDNLQKAFETLQKEQGDMPDWHPATGEMVQDLVHPSMYPLIYGRTRILDQEVVGVEGAIANWAGKGSVIPREDGPGTGDNYNTGVGGGTVPPNFWSDVYQWLPANVALQKDGSAKLTSYINNLHPDKHSEIYRTIEELIQAALPMWDQCLYANKDYRTKLGAGRLKPRMPYPDDADDDNWANWNPSDLTQEQQDEIELTEEDLDGESLDDYEESDHKMLKWKKVRMPANPEVTYEEIDYLPSANRRLQEQFPGLQVIVKMASIELTPEKPEFPAGGWHVEGQMNEHICGTALYYLDSENITPSTLSFRMQTSAYLEQDISVGQDGYHWLQEVYGTGLGSGSSPCLQNYGSVETHEGRLLAFPNVFQHRVSSFELKDKTKPGHRRFIALWLVDPTLRVLSTANVPPQRLDWWLESLLGKSADERDAAVSKMPAEIVELLKEKGLNTDNLTTPEGRLSVELMEMVRRHFNDDGDALLISADEAREHRAQLMKERGAFVKAAEAGWQEHAYSFCEH